MTGTAFAWVIGKIGVDRERDILTVFCTDEQPVSAAPGESFAACFVAWNDAGITKSADLTCSFDGALYACWQVVATRRGE